MSIHCASVTGRRWTDCFCVGADDMNPECRPPVLALLGPTASGKTDLALALAERWPIDIVNMDSAQVYRGMDIGTAKPDAATRARLPHHLFDHVDPAEAYSAGRFVRDARAAIERIQAVGRIPLLVGGTVLYFRALRDGLAPLPAADPETRERLTARAGRDGWPALHAELARIDPSSGLRVHPHDAQRIQRALEVWELTGNDVTVAQKHQIHAQTFYCWRRTLGQGAETFLSGKRPRTDPRIKQLRRKTQTQRGSDDSDPRADVVKKKDELGLTNRRMGATYSNIQRMRFISEIERSKAAGITKMDTLKALYVCRSTF